MRRALLLVAAVAGCGSARFANRQILWVVKDDAPIPVPKSREVLLYGPGVRDELFRSADRVLDFDYGVEAANVNALDEVPDSAWFEDPRRDPRYEDGRLRPLANDQMFEGATRGEAPPVPPFTVEKAKSEGATAGFVVHDATGRKYLIKLDPPGMPKLATSTEVVASRLVWSLGWRVPKIWMMEVKPSQLVVGPKATTKNWWYQTVPLDEKGLHKMLRPHPIEDDQPMPASVSLWLPGKIIGPYSYMGRRKDDPNDLVPHQDRRDLRGYRIVSAWINSIDTQELNTLDSYVGEPGQGYVVHYQQDVGGAFGSRAVGPTEYYMGSERYFQSTRVLFSLLTLGAFPRPWEGVLDDRARELALWPELGYFDSKHFDPRGWQPMVFNPAFARSTSRDDYWGAKRVAAVTVPELKAAIAAGRYRPEVAERLFQVLWERREKIVRAYLWKMTPLDYFRVENGRLCFEDVARELGTPEIRIDRVIDGRGFDGKCISLHLGGYQVVRLQTKRPGQKHWASPVRVNLIDGYVVGVER